MRFLSDLDKIHQIVNLIEKSSYAVVFSGAGISTPSGIPDFRSQNSGLWTKNNPIEVASLTSFKKTPEVFFDWYHPLLQAILNARPNSAHKAIAHLEKFGKIKAVITQNIDLLHQKAGANNVIELHGSINSYSCLNCSFVTTSEQKIIQDFLQNKKIPCCPNCSVPLKPSIIFYEEMLPAMAWEQAYAHSQKADLFIVVGSSLEVYPANLLPEIAVSNNAKLLINTFSLTPLDNIAEIVINDDVAEVWNYIASVMLPEVN